LDGDDGDGCQSDAGWIRLGRGSVPLTARRDASYQSAPAVQDDRVIALRRMRESVEKNCDDLFPRSFMVRKGAPSSRRELVDFKSFFDIDGTNYRGSCVIFGPA